MSDGLSVREIAAREGKAPHPAVLLFHGRGADEEDLLPLAAELDPRYRYVSARAPLDAGFGGYKWYDSERIGQPDPGTFGESLRLAGELAGRLAAEAPLVVVCGFSQGAVMALGLLAGDQQVAAAAALSGFLAPGMEPSSLAGRPVFVGHGRLDPVIPIAFGQQARDGLDAAGAQVTYREYPMAHAISQQEVLDLRAWLAERLG